MEVAGSAALEECFQEAIWAEEEKEEEREARLLYIARKWKVDSKNGQES
jgi:hypothetical protein